MRRARAALAASAMGAFLLLSGPAASAQDGDLDCGDFSSEAAAQANLDANPSDPNRLDANDNGQACENFDGPYMGGGEASASTTVSTPVVTSAPVTSSPVTSAPVTSSPVTSPPVTTGSDSGVMPSGGVATGFGGTADQGDDGGTETTPWSTWVLGAGMLLTAIGVTQWWARRS